MYGQYGFRCALVAACTSGALISETALADGKTDAAVAKYERLARKYDTRVMKGMSAPPGITECVEKAVAADDSKAAYQCYGGFDKSGGPDYLHSPNYKDFVKEEEARKACEATGAVDRCQAAGMRAFAAGLERVALKPPVGKAILVTVATVAGFPVAVVMTPVAAVYDATGKSRALTNVVWYAWSEAIGGLAGEFAHAKEQGAITRKFACTWRLRADEIDPKGGSLADKLKLTSCTAK